MLDELDISIAAGADPYWHQHDDESWKHESAVNKLVGKFINSLLWERRAKIIDNRQACV
jgi:hypothetical protein